VAAVRDLSHLKAPAQDAAKLSNAERIDRVRRERWVGYPRANYAVDRLNTLLKSPRRQRMPNLLIVGPTNNGKSMLVERFRRVNEPQRFAGETDKEVIPIICLQMPSDPSIGRFYAVLMGSMGAPLRPVGRWTPDYEHRALALLRLVGARILIIDELHNILAGSTKSQREFLNLLRFLGNELRIPIVGVGTKEAYLAIRSDDQLENRFEPLSLPPWQMGDDLRSLLASFAASFPLRRRSALGSEEMARYVLYRSEGTIGEITQLLSAAAIAAIQSGEEAITSKMLQMADYRSPSERRQTFEREVA
jgi:Bacterial TniB protein